MLILDLDLDFIVSPIRRAAPDKKNFRYEGEHIKIWPESDFRSFIEQRLHLSLSEKIQGRACEHHKEVFYHVQSLIKDGILLPPFQWVHIDAHDDVEGLPCKGWLSSADFILHLIAHGWLEHIDFVLPASEYVPHGAFKDDPPRVEFDGHCCPANFQDENRYCLPRKPDFVFLTRSPDFTPERADPLFDLAKSYIAEI